MGSWKSYLDAPIPVLRHPVIARLVAAHFEVASLRKISASYFDILIQRPIGKCRWCLNLTGNPYVVWCSQECIDEWTFQANDRLKAKAAYLRDAGCCVLCGFTGHEVDHIVPVILGGGLCSLDNLRTLCSKCHKGESKKLQSRLSKLCFQRSDGYRLMHGLDFVTTE